MARKRRGGASDVGGTESDESGEEDYDVDASGLELCNVVSHAQVGLQTRSFFIQGLQTRSFFIQLAHSLTTGYFELVTR